MDEAKRLGDYVVANYDGKIDILYGASFGCRILREVLADTRLTIITTIADGMETYDYPDATYQSWRNQDYSCFGRHFNFDDFKRTDMYIWHGVSSGVEKKLAKNIENSLKKANHA